MRLLSFAVRLAIAGAVLTFLGFGSAVVAALSNVAGSGATFLVVTIMGFIFGGLGTLALLVGLFLYVFVPAFRPELASVGYGSHVTVLSTMAVAVIISLLIYGVVLGFAAVLGVLNLQSLISLPLDGPAVSVENLVLASVALELSLLLVIYLRIVRPGVITWSQMGLTLGSLGSRVALGSAAGLGLIVLSGALEYLLRQMGIQQTQAEMFAAVREATLPQFLVVLLAAAALAPLAEEAFFRGYVFSAYRKQKGLWQAFLFSSIIFALVHLNVPALLPLFVVGFALAGVYWLSGSLVTSIVAHGLNNAVALLLLYLGVQ